MAAGGESDESSDEDEEDNQDEDEDNKEEEEDEGENDVVEEENRRVNSNYLKNGNCANQEFHGCDDKCIKEDLTPYQVHTKHLLGLKPTHQTKNYSIRTAKDAWGSTSVPNVTPGNFGSKTLTLFLAI